MILNLNFNKSLALFCALFLIIIPLATIVHYFDNSEILKVILILLVNSLAILLFILFSGSAINHEERQLEFSEMHLLILSIIFLLPLIFFINQNIQVYDLIQIFNFSGRYRQGEYSGSGIYTAWSTQILPIIIFVILINNGFSRSLIVPILVVIFASVILGLRIYLWAVFVGCFFALTRKINTSRMLMGLSFVLIFFLYKLLLDGNEDTNVQNLIINQLIRPDLHVIVKFSPFNDGILDLFEYFPYVRYFFGYDYSAFKEFYVPSIPNLSQHMPFISLYSGVALPGYVMLYNIFFIFSIIPSLISLLILLCLIVSVKKVKKIFFKIFSAYLFSVISLAYLEDVTVLYKLEAEILFFVLTYISYLFIARRKSYSHKLIK